MNLNGQCWILSKYFNALNQAFFEYITRESRLIHSSGVYHLLLSILWNWTILTHTQAFALTDGWCRDNEMLYCAASGNCLSLVCENQGHSVSPCHCHTGSHLLSVCLSRLQPDTYSSHTLTYSTRLNHFFLILSYSRILLCATFGCHCWGFWKRDLLSISSSAQTHTGTEWHASLADSQVLKGRNLSLICLSSSVLLQWPNQTERESLHTHSNFKEKPCRDFITEKDWF